ncbi:MAG: FG-GAP repeat protein, partial [Persicimonas sp.]
VFERDQGGADNWGEVKKLVASDPAEDDGFGWSVSASGDVVAIGAGNADANGLDSGAAYVFERDQGGADNWGEVKKIVGSDTAIGDHLGGSISLDGDVLVAGASRDYTNGTRTGSAHVFERDEGGADNWGEVKKLVASDYSTNARFGIGVSVSGDVVVVGADRDSESATEAGAAYVFERDEGGATNWGEVKKLMAANGAAEDDLGWSVATGPDMVAVGAMGGDGIVTDSGAVVVFGEASTPTGDDAGSDGGHDVGEDAGPDGGHDAADDTGADAADGADVVDDAAGDAKDTADTADAEDATTQDSGVDVTEDTGSDAADDTGPSAQEDAGAADAAGTDDGCGCSSAAGPSNALSVLWVLLGLVGLRVRRRFLS